MLKDSIGRMRLISIVEGISFLVLLGIAMPLKYFAGMPEVVSVVGMAHGILFILYAVAALNLMLARKWSFEWLMAAMVASVIPFGTFVIDARLRKHEGVLSSQRSM